MNPTERYWSRMGHPCRCGHDRLGHAHLRPGTDCALCPCRAFRRRWLP